VAVSVEGRLAERMVAWQDLAAMLEEGLVQAALGVEGGKAVARQVLEGVKMVGGPKEGAG